jgi:hypothetical protein
VIEIVNTSNQEVESAHKSPSRGCKEAIGADAHDEWQLARIQMQH